MIELKDLIIYIFLGFALTYKAQNFNDGMWHPEAFTVGFDAKGLPIPSTSPSITATTSTSMTQTVAVKESASSPTSIVDKVTSSSSISSTTTTGQNAESTSDSLGSKAAESIISKINAINSSYSVEQTISTKSVSNLPSVEVYSTTQASSSTSTPPNQTLNSAKVEENPITSTASSEISKTQEVMETPSLLPPPVLKKDISSTSTPTSSTSSEKEVETSSLTPTKEAELATSSSTSSTSTKVEETSASANSSVPTNKSKESSISASTSTSTSTSTSVPSETLDKGPLKPLPDTAEFHNERKEKSGPDPKFMEGESIE